MGLFTMAKIVIKSIFRRPATVRYPFAPREFHARSRGSIAITVDQCIFCGVCQRKCPTGALAVARQEKTWVINRLRCISCGYCVEVCPKKCLAMLNTYTPATQRRGKEKFSKA